MPDPRDQTPPGPLPPVSIELPSGEVGQSFDVSSEDIELLCDALHRSIEKVRRQQ
jgi:hypothetical protein